MVYIRQEAEDLYGPNKALPLPSNEVDSKYKFMDNNKYI